MGSVDTHIKVQLISPLMAGIEFVIFCTLFVDAKDVLFLILIGHLFLLGGFFPAPFYLAFHICIDKDPERLLIPQDIVSASSYNDTV